MNDLLIEDQTHVPSTGRSLAELAPKHWPRARELAAVIAEYRCLPSPTIKDVDAAASKLNIKRRAFYYILQRTARPSAKAKRRERSYSVDKEFSSRTQLKQRRADRARMLSNLPDDERIVVDHAGLEVAISSSSGKAPAYLTVVMDRGNGIVLGHCVSTEEPSPASVLAALLDWSKRNTSSSLTVVPAITMHSGRERDWASLRKLMRESGMEMRGRSMKQLSKGSFLFERMDHVGRIPLRPRLDDERLRARIKSLPAVDLEDSRHAIAHAIARWNDGREDPKPLVLPMALRDCLADQSF